MATYDIRLRVSERDDCEHMPDDSAMYALVRGLVEFNSVLDVDYCHVTKVDLREHCPVGDLTGHRHKYEPGTGVVIPWDVVGDPRSGVEVCLPCHVASIKAGDES